MPAENADSYESRRAREAGLTNSVPDRVWTSDLQRSPEGVIRAHRLESSIPSLQFGQSTA